MRAVLRTTVAAAAAGALLGWDAGIAQDGAETPAAPRLVLDYEIELEADSNARLRANSPGATYSMRHDLGFAFRSETRTQSFSLNTDLIARIANDPRNDEFISDVSQGGVDLDYTRTASRSRLSFGASYRRDELVFTEPFFLDLDGDTIIDEAGFTREDGTVTRSSVRTTLETGIDRPLSTVYSFSAQQRDFSETGDPDLFDSRSYRASVTAQLRFSPVARGRVTAGYRQADFDNFEERETQTATLSAGVAYALNPTLSLDASVGYSRKSETETRDGDRVETVDEGINASIDLTQEMPDGVLFGTFSRSVQDAGFRSTLQVGRNFEFPNSELEASIGVTALDEGDLGSVFNLSYSRSLADGSLGASLQRRVAFSTLDEEKILTSAAINYSRQVTDLSRLGLNLDVARIEQVATEDEEQRTEVAFTASVQRELTADWSLGFGYRGRYNDVEGSDNAVSNAVFLTLGRGFVIRP